MLLSMKKNQLSLALLVALVSLLLSCYGGGQSTKLSSSSALPALASSSQGALQSEPDTLPLFDSYPLALSSVLADSSLTEESFSKLLKEIRSLGYKQILLDIPLVSISSEKIALALNQAQLNCLGIKVELGMLHQNSTHWIQTAQTLKAQIILTSSDLGAENTNSASLDSLSKLIEAVGTDIKQAGLTLVYLQNSLNVINTENEKAFQVLGKVLHSLSGGLALHGQNYGDPKFYSSLGCPVLLALLKEQGNRGGSPAIGLGGIPWGRTLRELKEFGLKWPVVAQDFKSNALQDAQSSLQSLTHLKK